MCPHLKLKTTFDRVGLPMYFLITISMSKGRVTKFVSRDELEDDFLADDMNTFKGCWHDLQIIFLLLYRNFSVFLEPVPLFWEVSVFYSIIIFVINVWKVQSLMAIVKFLCMYVLNVSYSLKYRTCLNVYWQKSAQGCKFVRFRSINEMKFDDVFKIPV